MPMSGGNNRPVDRVGPCCPLPINTSSGLGLTHLTFCPTTGRINKNPLADVLLTVVDHVLAIPKIPFAYQDSSIDLTYFC